MAYSLTEQLARRLNRDQRTQQEIANAAGVSQPTIHKMMRGGTVKLEVAERVAKVLRCPLRLVPKQ